jgi:hypothetical protein
MLERGTLAQARLNWEEGSWISVALSFDFRYWVVRYGVFLRSMDTRGV